MNQGSYCLKCKTKTGSIGSEITTTKNNRTMEISKCSVCGTKKCRFIKNNSGGSILNKLIDIVPEMHMKLDNGKSENVPGGDFNNTGKYSYCGPGTKFQQRKKQGYKGVNQLDQACFKHDSVYDKFSDDSHRNTADNELVNAASKIANDPTVSEDVRKDAKLVSMLISTKSYLGLGLKPSSKKKKK